MIFASIYTGFLESIPRKSAFALIAMSLDSVVTTGFMIMVRTMVSNGEMSF